MALHHSFGIDIGTSTVKIYDHSGGQIQKERNMIAIRDAESVFAIGNDAYDLFGKTPDNIEVYTPMANGRISDVSMMEAILHTLLERGQSRIGYGPSLYFSVPTDMTEIEKRAYHTIASRGMLRRSRIYMVERAIADAVAFDIPIFLAIATPSFLIRPSCAVLPASQPISCPLAFTRIMLYPPLPSDTSLKCSGRTEIS